MHSVTFEQVEIGDYRGTLVQCPCGWSTATAFGPVAVRLAYAHLTYSAVA
ncbi:MAG: hypothetical protein WCF36_19000 [Candidatus Nanopelagicales bacterium]